MNLKEYKRQYEEFSNSPLVDQLTFGLKRPNIFEILKISSAEIRHSNFLSWLLDPKAGHGLGPLFLQKILRKIFSDDKSAKYDEFYIDEINFNKVEIHREWKHFSSGKRNSLDILIKHPDFIVGIENKIWTTDAVLQLKEYKSMIEECFPDHQGKCVYVYLTPEGLPPSDEEMALDYIFLSYRTITDYLKNMVQIYDAGISSPVKQYINDYITILLREIMEEEELSNYAKKIYKSHKELMDFVFTYGKTYAFSEAFDEFIKPLPLAKTSLRANNWITFIPVSWKELLMNHKEFLKNDTYPVLFWLEFYPKRSGSSYMIKMGIQVRPFKDEYQEERLKILEALRSADSDIKPRNSKEYTTLLTETKDVQDISDLVEILSAMNELHKRFETKASKIESLLKSL